jgi:hypothetical protein
LVSRTETDPRLRGTKHRAANEREVSVVHGHDGRLVVLVPETAGRDVVGLTLLHVAPALRLRADVVREVLTGYRNRYLAILDAVTETQRVFDDDVLGAVDLPDLLTQPVSVLADHWHVRVGRGASSEPADRPAQPPESSDVRGEPEPVVVVAPRRSPTGSEFRRPTPVAASLAHPDGSDVQPR